MSGKRLLLVEDELLVAEDLRRKLGRAGYDVVAATDDGDAAFDLAGRLSPDLVLMDIRLRGKTDGVTAADLIRRELSLPVVFLTAHADEATLARARVTEPFGYLLKPFEDREVRIVIEMALYRHEAERRRRADERRQAAILAGIADAVVAVDRGGTITYANRAAGDLLGRDPGAMTGMKADDACRVVGEAPGEGAKRLRRHDGSECFVEYAVRPLNDGDGGTVLILRDVSERVRARAEARILEEQLSQTQKMEAIGQFAGGVAHDFNNLLTAIIGYAELLSLQLRGSPDVRSLADEITRTAQRAGDLTRRLLLFSRKQTVRPDVVRLDQVVRGAEGLLRRLMPSHIRLDIELSDGLLPIKADGSRIEQVLLNLASNAVDAMPDGGRLVVSAEQAELGPDETRLKPDLSPGRYLRLRVSDTGTGIPAEVLPRIFEPFFTTKDVGKGTGLGLATVYGIVKNGGGRVEVSSEAGRGTAFDIYWPSSPESAPDAGAYAAPVAEDLPRGSERLLLVEDEDNVRVLAARVLREAGYDVTAAANGPEALERAAASGALDLLVTDVMMPHMSGTTLALTLSNVRPGLRVLFMSGYAPGDQVRDAAGKIGADWLAKPFTPAQLARKVRELLDR